MDKKRKMPEDNSHIRGRDVGRGFEAFYPDEFTTNNPRGPYSIHDEFEKTFQQEYKVDLGTDLRYRINDPGVKMSHATHFNPAMKIVEDCMTFKPAQKLSRGPKYSIKCVNKVADGGGDIFEKLPKDRAMLPGYYCWFAAIPPDNFSLLAFNKLIEQHPRIVPTMSHKLKPDSSVYGTIAFTTSMATLLESYKKRFPMSNELRFIKAGTLRYGNEICYVIVVTVDATLLPASPTITQDEAMVENIQLPFVRLHNQITNKELWCSWEQTVFAFHYPGTDCVLQLPPSEVEIHPVKHHCFNKELQPVSYKYPTRCHVKTFAGSCPDAEAFGKLQCIPFPDLLKEQREFENRNVDEYQKDVERKIVIEDATKLFEHEEIQF